MCCSVQTWSAEPQKTRGAGSSAAGQLAAKTPEGEYAQGFKDGLEKHWVILESIRSDANRARSEYEARMQSIDKELGRTHWGNNIILGLMVVILGLMAVLLGAGLFSLKTAHDRLSSAEAGAAAAQKKKEEVEQLVQAMRQEVESAKQEVRNFVAFRESIFAEVSAYLKKFRLTLKGGHLGQFDPVQRARIKELDHLTFLSTPFWFRVPEQPEEIVCYSEFLLQSARAFLSEANPGEALARIDKVLTMCRQFNPQNNELMAKAYSLRAVSYMHLLADELKPRTVPRWDRDLNARKHRTEIEESIRQAKRLYPKWAPTYLWEAMYCSLSRDIPAALEKKQRAQLFREAQQQAIDSYREAINNADVREPDYSSHALQNLCCCLKRMSDAGGNYQVLFEELEGSPDEKQLAEKYRDSEENASAAAFWKRLLMDRVFFNEISGDTTAYAQQWVRILDQKCNLFDWRAFCKSMAVPSPGPTDEPRPDRWDIRIWEEGRADEASAG
jgi:hypothetical protein